MKVICINAGVIDFTTFIAEGVGLIEGKIYTAIGEWVDEDGDDHYILEEFANEVFTNGFVQAEKGARLKQRFRIIDTDWIDEAIEKALNEEPELVNA